MCHVSAMDDTPAPIQHISGLTLIIREELEHVAGYLAPTVRNSAQLAEALTATEAAEVKAALLVAHADIQQAVLDSEHVTDDQLVTQLRLLHEAGVKLARAVAPVHHFLPRGSHAMDFTHGATMNAIRIALRGSRDPRDVERRVQIAVAIKAHSRA